MKLKPGPFELKLRDTGGSQRTFQNVEKDLLDHNWTIISAALSQAIRRGIHQFQSGKLAFNVRIAESRSAEATAR